MVEIKKDKQYMELAFSTLLGQVNLPSYSNKLTDELIREMLNYSAIKKCVNTLIRGVSSRELVVVNESNNNNDKRLLDIQFRINGIKYKTKLIENVAMSAFERFSLHEIVYNEDFTIKELVKIPNELVKYDKENKKHYIDSNNQKIDISDRAKWLFSTFNSDLININGKSLLESVLKDYQNIKFIKDKMDYIISKYGETVIIFAYGVGQEEKEIKETAEAIKKANSSNVIAMPLVDGNLKDNIFTLRLNDIDSVMYERLIDRYEKNIVTTLLGSSLTIDNSGGGSSYALGLIQKEEKEKIEDSIALFVRDELDKLIDIDGAFFGYNPTEYYISIDRPENEENIIKIQKEKEELKNLKIQGIEALSRAGYEIDIEELTEMLGVKKVSKKEYSLFN